MPVRGDEWRRISVSQVGSRVDTNDTKLVTVESPHSVSQSISDGSDGMRPRDGVTVRRISTSFESCTVGSTLGETGERDASSGCLPSRTTRPPARNPHTLPSLARRSIVRTEVVAVAQRGNARPRKPLLASAAKPARIAALPVPKPETKAAAGALYAVPASCNQVVRSPNESTRRGTSSQDAELKSWVIRTRYALERLLVRR